MRQWDRTWYTKEYILCISPHYLQDIAISIVEVGAITAVPGSNLLVAESMSKFDEIRRPTIAASSAPFFSICIMSTIVDVVHVE